jgi:histidyl-tRNA synthetase
LALTADSLIVAARTAAGVVASAPGPVHLYGVVPIFRYRRARYRNWNHLVLSFFNEDGGMGSDLALARVLKAFFDRLQVTFSLDCCDYGTFDAVLAARGFDAPSGRRVLHEVRKGQVDGPAGELVAALLEGAGPGPALELSNGNEAVAGRLATMNETLGALRACEVPVEQNWRFDHGGEHHSGFSFVIRATGADGKLADVGDGGGFHAIVRSSFPALRTAWSSALSLDIMADLGMAGAASSSIVHMVHLDSTVSFFVRACGQVRASGLAVREHESVHRVSRFVNGLPKERTAFFCLVGRREEETGSVRLTSVLEREVVVYLTIDGEPSHDLRDRLSGPAT